MRVVSTDCRYASKCSESRMSRRLLGASPPLAWPRFRPLWQRPPSGCPARSSSTRGAWRLSPPQPLCRLPGAQPRSRRSPLNRPVAARRRARGADDNLRRLPRGRRPRWPSSWIGRGNRQRSSPLPLLLRSPRRLSARRATGGRRPPLPLLLLPAASVRSIAHRHPPSDAHARSVAVPPAASPTAPCASPWSPRNACTTTTRRVRKDSRPNFSSASRRAFGGAAPAPLSGGDVSQEECSVSDISGTFVVVRSTRGCRLSLLLWT